MATLVLGIAGSALGGPIGGAIGASIGSLLDNQLLFPLIFGTDTIEGPRLDGSQRAMRSSEGSPLPYPMGQRTRYGGVVIWPKDFELEEVIEERRVGGGIFGVAGQKVREFRYFATFAVCLGVVDTDEKISRVRRLYADAKELWDGGGAAPQRADDIRFYDESQEEPDPLIEAWIQSVDDQQIQTSLPGQAPVWKGMAYVVIERLQVQDFGNRVPEINGEIVRDANVSVAKAIRDIYDRRGIPEDEYDVTRLRKCFTGMMVPGPSAAKRDLQPIEIAYALNPIELNGKMIWTEKGREVNFRYDEATLVAASPNEIGAMGFEVKEGSEYEGPGAVEVTFTSLQNNLQEGSQIAAVPTSSESTQQITLPLTLNDREAMEIAQRELWAAQTGRRTAKQALPPGFLPVVAGDAMLNAAGQRWRVDQMNITPQYDIEIESTRYVPEVYTQQAVADEVPEGPGEYEPPELDAVILDLPALGNGQVDAEGAYLSCMPAIVGAQFRGAEVFASTQDDTVDTNDESTTIARIPMIGRYVTGLSEIATPGSWDYRSEVVVEFPEGRRPETRTITDDEWLTRSQNVLAIYKANGQYEIVAARRAERVAGTNEVIFRDLVRGLRLTEWFMGVPARPGGRVAVLTDDGTANFLELPKTGPFLPEPRIYARPVPSGAMLSDAEIQSRLWEKNIARRPAPFILGAWYDYGTGDLTVRWAPRFRTIADIFGGQDEGLGLLEAGYASGDFPFEAMLEVRRESPSGTIGIQRTSFKGGTGASDPTEDTRFFDDTITASERTSAFGDDNVGVAIGVSIGGPFAWIIPETR